MADRGSGSVNRLRRYGYLTIGGKQRHPPAQVAPLIQHEEQKHHYNQKPANTRNKRLGGFGDFGQWSGRPKSLVVLRSISGWVPLQPLLDFTNALLDALKRRRRALFHRGQFVGNVIGITGDVFGDRS